eukprot:SM000015S01225  [mRNA]  locus=s15:681331:683452:- [translate_table: standard]
MATAVAGAAATALAVLLLVAAAGSASAQRYVVVGNDQDPIEPWTQLDVNYTDWAIKHPLYAGDICGMALAGLTRRRRRWRRRRCAAAVAACRLKLHVVWQLPDKSDFDGCVYDRALFIGNTSAGVGKGFWLTVTDTPQYIACGINGHCEAGQKVVINGSLGKLPTKLVNAPVPPGIYPYSPPPPTTTSSPPPSSTDSPPSSSPPSGSPPASSPPPSTAPPRHGAATAGGVAVLGLVAAVLAVSL